MSDSKTDCPCGSGLEYANCCEPYIKGIKAAPTAEALMRSRYTAYALHEKQYLLDSWHASTRPADIELDAAVKWIRLKILASDEDNVEFVAACRVQGRAHRLHENSRFVCEDGRWFYLDGVTSDD